MAAPTRPDRVLPRRSLLGATLGAAPLGIATLALPVAAAAASVDGVSEVAAGTLYAWGGGAAQPMLGEATDPSANVWEPTVASSTSGWTAVAVGPDQVLGIRAGRLYAWGSNVSGATGLGVTTGATATPTEIVVAGVSTWTAVAAGGDTNGGASTSLAIGDGKLFAFGSNDYAMTGLGSGVTAATTTPTQVGSATDWTAVSAGQYHCLGIRGGALYGWGFSLSGSLGLGSTANAPTYDPTQVGSATDWTACSAGLSATSGGIRAGELYTWGGHTSGVTGQGVTTGSVGTPQRIGVAGDWTAVSIGTDTAAGIRGGELHSWGTHDYGITGQGLTSGSVSTPQRVGSDTGWSRVEVAPSVLHAIRSGRLYVAGPTAIGIVPTGSGLSEGTPDRSSPTQVGSATDWSAIATGNREGGVVGIAIRG